MQNNYDVSFMKNQEAHCTELPVLIWIGMSDGALELQDCKLLAELSLCDMPAIDAYYHNMCLVALYNRERSVKKSPD